MGEKLILVTGGAGYIGSHAVVALAEAGYRSVILDNLCNSSESVLARLNDLRAGPVEFVKADVRDRVKIDQLFTKYDFYAVFHFAGLKAVGESVSEPTRYLDNNVSGLLSLLSAMESHGVRRLVFSSSATVYGTPTHLPVKESCRLAPNNPYALSKVICEDVLRELYKCDEGERWQIAILRYFNPVGAHESGLIGENPNGVPNNLMPYISQVAAGLRDYLPIFGGDYETPDGTGVRDYIHVVDLACGHVAALNSLNKPSLLTVNLGTGKGVSVKELVTTFSGVNGVKVPYKICSRRPGDIDQCYADVAAAKVLLKWEATLDVEAMCRDSWRWQENLAKGFETAI
jgi:UDP-glucose 4-epimerase